MKACRKMPRRQPTLMMAIAVVWVAPMWLQGAELGRLFTTPQERAMLDRLRQEGPKPIAPEVVAPRVTPEPISEMNPHQPITVNGLIRRSDGTNTIWVNGVNSLEGEYDSQGFQVDARRIRNGRVTVTVSGQPVPQVEMKPGQTFDPESGRVVDRYQVPKEASRAK